VNKQIAVLVVCGLASLLVLFGLFGYRDFPHAAPAKTAVVATVNRPFNLADKVFDSEMLRKLFPPSSAGEADPQAEAVNALRAAWTSLKDRSFVVAAARFFVKSVRVAWTPVPAPDGHPVLTPALYVDGGFLARLAGLLMPRGLFPGPAKSFAYRGRRVFVADAASFAFIDNFVVIGPIEYVRAALDGLAGGSLARGDNGERFRRSLALCDRRADVSAIFLDMDLFRPARPLDPRSFFAAAAIELAVANLELHEDGPRVQLALQPLSGKLACPLTTLTPGEFVTRALTGGDDVPVYVAARLEQPGALSAQLLDLLADPDDMKSLQKKLALMMIDTFFGYTGHEFAIVMDAGKADFPVCVFQLAKEKEMLELLGKLSKGSDSQPPLLSEPLGPGGKTLADSLEDLKDDAKLHEILAQAPSDKWTAIGELAQQVRSGHFNLEKLAQETHRVYMFGRSWHWRIARGLLILATTAEAADRYRTKIDLGAIAPLLQNGAAYVPVDGPFLAALDLRTFFADRTSLPGPLARAVGFMPKLAVGSRYSGFRLTIAAVAPSQLGLGAPTQVGLFWMTILHGLRGLVVAFGLFCLALAGRAAWLIKYPPKPRPKW
jgi:hypothetical protein